MTNTPSLDLIEFVETQILPRYAQFDKAHNMEHATRVIRRSLDLARKIGADIDMSYAIAAYHDLGLTGPRAIHHITSGKILLADARLKRWFSKDQLQMMDFFLSYLQENPGVDPLEGIIEAEEHVYYY